MVEEDIVLHSTLKPHLKEYGTRILEGALRDRGLGYLFVFDWDLEKSLL